MIEVYNCDFREKMHGVIANHNNVVIVSDPPFNINYHYAGYSDNMSDNEYKELIRAAFYEHPCVIIHYPEELYKIAKWIDKTPERVVSWVYNSNTAKQHRDVAFFGVKPDFSKVRQPYKNPNDKRIKERIKNGAKGAKLYDWWNVNQIKNVSKEKTAHPCQMPLKVMENIVGVLPANAVIIDPFMGSGTTGEACKNAGRDFVGFEIVPEYFEIARNRLNGGQNGKTAKDGDQMF